MYPQTVGPYELLEPLGTGGMGEVFHARDTRLGRMVAIKRIRSDRQIVDDDRERFRREARALAKLNHPAVVQLYDVLSADGDEWIVTEFVDGPTLRRLLAEGPMPPGEAIALGRQIIAGLTAAHAAGVIHRDLKTENVLIASDGRAKIVDFGVAKQLSSDADAPTLTDAGAMVGTVRSMSPEQVRGMPVGPRSDLFSFGVLLYETVCGISPFAASDNAAMLRRILEERQRPANEVAPEVPASLSQLIDHLLEKDPCLRPRNAGEVSRALAEMTASDEVGYDAVTTLVPRNDSEVEDQESDDDGLGESATNRPRVARRLAVATIVAILLLVATVAISWPRPVGLVLGLAGLLGPPENPPLPELPSIVILPFANLTGDPAQEIFCDGLTEDLTIDLSHNPQLFVISRTSAFSYKGQPVRVGEVGRELGVRYVLEGTVRKSEDLLRITARLSDASTGFQVLSLRYDRVLDEVFALQSQISQEILGALRVEIDEAELARIRRRPTRDLTAYHAFIEGRALLRSNTRRDNAAARRLFEHAIAVDPGFADAYALLGGTYGVENLLRWNLDPALLERAEEFTRRALELDPKATEALVSLAILHFLRDQPQASLAAAEQALAIDANHSPANAIRGAALAALGRWLEALQGLNRAVRLDPRVPSIAMSALGNLKQLLGREQEAVELWERIRAANPDLIHPRIFLMTAYEKADRLEEARALAREIRAINPELTAEVAAVSFWKAEPSSAAAVAERRERLRRAGLP